MQSTIHIHIDCPFAPLSFTTIYIVISDDLYLYHGEETVSILLVAIASLKPNQQKVKGVAKLPTVPSPDLKTRSS